MGYDAREKEDLNVGQQTALSPAGEKVKLLMSHQQPYRAFVLPALI